jgi:hypothetical protein
MSIKVSVLDYWEQECAFPCTSDGCPGHHTDIPLSIELEDTEKDHSLTLFLPWEDQGYVPSREDLDLVRAFMGWVDEHHEP